MSAKQCRKCGRFQGANHVCPTLKAPTVSVSSPQVTQKSRFKNTPVLPPVQVSTSKPVRPKIDSIISNPQKLTATIQALEFSIGKDAENPTEAQKQIRLKLEATFGKIDWNA